MSVGLNRDNSRTFHGFYGSCLANSERCSKTLWKKLWANLPRNLTFSKIRGVIIHFIWILIKPLEINSVMTEFLKTVDSCFRCCRFYIDDVNVGNTLILPLGIGALLVTDCDLRVWTFASSRVTLRYKNHCSLIFTGGPRERCWQEKTNQGRHWLSMVFKLSPRASVNHRATAKYQFEILSKRIIPKFQGPYHNIRLECWVLITT